MTSHTLAIEAMAPTTVTERQRAEEFNTITLAAREMAPPVLDRSRIK
jgi:hypothetical protein